MEPDRQWFLFAVIVYGVGMLYSTFLWRRGFQRDNWIHYGLLTIAFALHTVAMAKRGFSLNQCPVNNLYEASAFVLWTIAAGSLALGLLPKLRFLGVFTSPLLFGVGLFALWPGLDTKYVDNQPNFSSDWFNLHVPIILLGYGAFGLSATAGSMFLTQERNLKFHRARALFALLPPIQRLEKIITTTLAIGLTLLTVGVGIGAAFVESGTVFWSDSKTIWSFLVWAMYGGLLVLHFQFDQRGRRYAWWAIVAFGFVILTFWGTNLLSGIHNPAP
ncbi:MAG: cytochrome c biogenesis protein CcsA [Verrucomicrobiota bacterium]|nr:cytochrome c biogenesis protein CcsA [Verrucomicrobiota bacterium]MDP7048000.1 cytochrome c biogenesis protein CcsA [Verrucomicrobiota bacterium]